MSLIFLNICNLNNKHINFFDSKSSHNIPIIKKKYNYLEIKTHRRKIINTDYFQIYFK